MYIKKPSLSKSTKIPSAKSMKFGIVVAEWNSEITEALYEGCYQTLIKHQASPKNIIRQNVPGSFEIPFGAKLLAETNQYHAIICLGCIIKGETKHNEYISNAVAIGITELNLKYNIPFIFGVLTPNNMKEAKERTDGKYGNKGSECALTAIKMAASK